MIGTDQIRTQNERTSESSPSRRSSELADDIRRAYINYYDALRRLLLHRFGSSVEIEGVIQETYSRAIKNHNPELKPSLTFLFKIAVNLVKDRYRKAQVQSVDSHISLDRVSLVSNLESPEQILQSKQCVEEMQRTLRGLNPAWRRVFLLHRVKGLTYEEIAADLGLTKNQVRNYMHQVIVQLRKKLANYI